MDDQYPRSQNEHNLEEQEERKVFDVMRNENADLLDDFFTFKNVLITAVVLGALILLCYAVGNAGF